MAMDEVNSIAETMRAAMASQLNARQQAQQAKQHADQLALDQRKFDEEVSQHVITNKAAKTLLDAQLAAHQAGVNLQSQQMGEIYQKTGVTPAGATFSPAASSTPDGQANYTPVNPSQATGQVMQIPGMQSMTVQNPLDYAKQEAARATIIGAPAEAAKIREETAKQTAIEKGKIDLAVMTLDRINASKQYDETRAAQMKAADDARNVYTQAQENYRARLMANSKNGSTDVDLSPYIVQANNGELTLEGIKKLPLKPSDQMKVLNGVISNGGRVLKDADQQTIKDMSTISTALPHLSNALQILKENPTEARIPGTQAWKNYNEAINQVELVLPQVGRIIAGDKGRMSNQQIKYAEGSFIPSRNPLQASYVTNEKNAKDFTKTMQDIMDNHMIGMSPANKALIKENFGVKPLQLGGSAAPAAAPVGGPTQSGPTQSGPIRINYDMNGNPVQ